MLNIIIISCSIIAALIGAGFASGQEILCYFVVFERYGIYGLIASAVVFFVFIASVLLFSVTNRISSYPQFLTVFKGNLTRRLIKMTTIAFSFAVFSAMLSSLTEVISDLIPIPKAVSGLIPTTLAIIMLNRGTDKVFRFNGIIGICLVFFMVFAVLYILTWRETHAFSPVIIHSAADGVIYSGYNLITLTPVLVALSKKLNSKTDAISVTLVVTIITTLMAGLVFVLLSIYYNKINLGELPLLTLAKRQGSMFEAFYTLVLCGAVITTLLSSGAGLIDALGFKNSPVRIIAISVLSYGTSGIGFINLINIAYRICGIAGIILCGATIYCIQREKIRVKNLLL